MMTSSKLVEMMENIREDLSQDIDCGGDGSVEPDCKVKIPPKLDDLLTKKFYCLIKFDFVTYCTDAFTKYQLIPSSLDFIID